MNSDSTSVERMPAPRPPWGGIGTVFWPPATERLAGEFAIMTELKGTFLTAVKGGGQTTDVIHTDADLPRDWETFALWVDRATHQLFMFQTFSGEFITANDGGGLTSNTIFTTALTAGGWETFKLVPQFAPFYFAIQTLRGFFLTAVGGGGHNSGDTIHTDALKADTWEWFRLFRRSDLGAGSTYGIMNSGSGNVVGLGTWLVAINGGGQSMDPVLSDNSAVPYWISWTPLQQDDGTYALQTSTGNVLTANDGGVPGAGFRTDKWPDQIGDWEKFTLVDDGFFTAFIKTHAGTFLSDVLNNEGVGTITTVTDTNQATRWRFCVLNLSS